MPKLIRQSATVRDLIDWGPITTLMSGSSRARGLLLHRGQAGSPEAGLWECTPGLWECRVTRDEFCHFLEGRCIYTRGTGERTEIVAGDTAFFPAGWSGVCEVVETVRKVYMIR